MLFPPKDLNGWGTRIKVTWNAAREMDRVLCTYDADFLRPAAEGLEHAGIIFAQQRKASIGGWVKELRALHARLQPEEIQNQMVYLSLR